MATDVAGLYIGEISVLGPEGQRTGIFKRPDTAVEALTGGLQGDHQADRRVHGGPEKAVHHYAADNYKFLAARFPGIADALVPGHIGENVSTHGWTEDDVHLGDVFRIGAARVQVSQPRSPCWKGERPAIDDLALFGRIAGLAPDWKQRLGQRHEWLALQEAGAAS